MREVVWFTLLLALSAKGNTEINCDASERTVLKCIFPRNVNSTQTDFSVYFNFDYGHEELLVDCIWLDKKLECLKQEGFDVKQQVSETAEISLPTRFVIANGTYKCKFDGLTLENGIPCRFDEMRPNVQQKIQNNQFKRPLHENNLDDKEMYILEIAGGVFAALFIVGLIIAVKHRKRCAENRGRNIERETSTDILLT